MLNSHIIPARVQLFPVIARRHDAAIQGQGCITKSEKPTVEPVGFQYRFELLRSEATNIQLYYNYSMFLF